MQTDNNYNYANQNTGTTSSGAKIVLLNRLPLAFRDLLCVKDADYSTSQHDDETTNSGSNYHSSTAAHQTQNHDPNFQQAFHPDQMRCLALVSHNEMKATMKSFVLANKNILKHFRLTGTNSTMTMLKEVFKSDKSVVFGPSCSSGPLGGDAELVALMCADQLGGMIFFQDPMSAHPHQSDIDCLVRQAIVHNTMIASNPTSALMMMTTLRVALKENKPELIPSFFCKLQSPSVEAYKKEQNKIIASHSAKIPQEALQEREDSSDHSNPPSSLITNSPTSTNTNTSSASTSSATVVSSSPVLISPAASSTTISSVSSRLTLVTAPRALQHDIYPNDNDDSESIGTSVSIASRRRIDAQARLVESFATFVDSVARQNFSNHASLSRSHHSYFQAHRTAVANQRRPHSITTLPGWDEQQSDAVDELRPHSSSRSINRSDHSYFSSNRMMRTSSSRRPTNQRLATTRFDAMKLVGKEGSSTSLTSTSTTDTELTSDHDSIANEDESFIMDQRTKTNENSARKGSNMSSRLAKKNKGYSYMKNTLASNNRQRNVHQIKKVGGATVPYN